MISNQDQSHGHDSVPHLSSLVDLLFPVHIWPVTLTTQAEYLGFDCAVCTKHDDPSCSEKAAKFYKVPKTFIKSCEIQDENEAKLSSLHHHHPQL